ncbi:MAG TPA: phospholipid carrier-dependent glycosyltransferase, partial [Candidatus Andersenbacteria bacterium]|nr:phospholipid carrier-dependent glycosyltransferase [Candidatus Andersenbacteria bacterium]
MTTKFAVALLLVLSAATHLVWLTAPREVVFDEVHFGKFVTAYCCTGERFFDIHPPHAKLLIAGVAYLGGFRGGMLFETIGEPYGEVSPLALRLFPALTGVLLPVVFFLLLRELGARPGAALAGGLIIIFDNALLVQTRIVSLDGLLLLAIFASLLVAVRLPHVVTQSRRWWLQSLFAGCLAGLAVGVKFTGLVAPGLLSLLWLWHLLQLRHAAQVRRWILVGLLGVVAAGVVYLGGWVLHFALLTEPGSGDAWRVPVFEGNLLGSFWRETVALHRLMLDANYNLPAGHPDASSWWEWPLMRTSVFYWQSLQADSGRVAGIYLLGNPAVWWGSTMLLVLFLLDVPRLWRERRLRFLALPIVGYVVSYAPLMRVPRALFLYHYLTPLLFAWLLIILWLGHCGYFVRQELRRQHWSYYAGLGLLILLFLVFSPLTYGLLLPPTLADNLF